MTFRKSMFEILDGAMEELRKVMDTHGDSRTKLAKILPQVARVGTTLLDQPPDNKVIARLAGLQEMKSFCSLVYTDSIK
jgi:hypothetical protein